MPTDRSSSSATQAPPRRVLDPHPRLRVAAGPLAERLVTFLQDAVKRRFGFERVVLGISGGVDSAVVAALAARAFGPERVLGLRLPYGDLGGDVPGRAELVFDRLGIDADTVDISGIVDAYERTQAGMNWHRRGNVQARARMLVLFDKLTELGALPLGTTNRTEYLFGYFTQGGDDVPQVNPIGDLYKTQVWQLAEHLGVPRAVIDQAPSAGLEPGQTDEGDFGLPYETIDLVLSHIEGGFGDEEIRALGVAQDDIDAVRERVRSTHRKRVGRLVPQMQPAAPDAALFFRPRGGTST